jgi:hypothetical protein
MGSSSPRHTSYSQDGYLHINKDGYLHIKLEDGIYFLFSPNNGEKQKSEEPKAGTKKRSPTPSPYPMVRPYQ